MRAIGRSTGSVPTIASYPRREEYVGDGLALGLMSQPAQSESRGVLGVWDAPARTAWNGMSRLWVTPEELRVSNANGYGRDRVVAKAPGTELRLSSRLGGTSILWRQAGSARWKRLCIYFWTSGTTVPTALARAGWIPSETPAAAPPEDFFQCCRIHWFTPRGWCVVGEESISVERKRSTVTVLREDLSAVRLEPGRQTWDVQILRDRDGGEYESLCRSFAPQDLMSALTARGWPLARAV